MITYDSNAGTTVVDNRRLLEWLCWMYIWTAWERQGKAER